MASATANTLCKKLLNVKGAVVTDHDFYTDCFTRGNDEIFDLKLIMGYEPQITSSGILLNDSILTSMEPFDKIIDEEVTAMMPFQVEKQFISSQELHEAGFSNYKIRQMVSAGALIGVNRKWYENAHYTGEINDFYAVSAYAEQGVVCLISAAVYHELSGERPSQIDIAIPRNVRIPDSPDWPAMKFYRMVEPRYSTGIVEVKENGNSFRIYDKEKTVCDVIYHRNKMGFEPAMEVLKRYVQRPDRDINRLITYAKRLQVETTIKQYLEALL